MLASALRLLVTVLAIALGVEGGYRLYLWFKYPDHFKTTTEIDAAEFSVWSASPWRYDPVYGYGYVPGLKVDSVQLNGGGVTGCSEDTAGGCDDMICEMTDASLSPANARRPVSIS